ncbi:MAG: hypothetical protein LBQ16_03180 [Gracilibacteraceae bacterium]|jgi:hypothetical protein|nr:hypothetical protein [Gracilibacteraceae bacterium]
MLWLLVGIIIGGGAIWLIAKTRIVWYQYVLGILGVALLLFTLQNYLGFLAEMEGHAAGFSLLIMGLPGLVLALLAVVLPRLLNQRKSNNAD